MPVLLAVVEDRDCPVIWLKGALVIISVAGQWIVDSDTRIFEEVVNPTHDISLSDLIIGKQVFKGAQ